jgi:hypothetical protein
MSEILETVKVFRKVFMISISTIVINKSPISKSGTRVIDKTYKYPYKRYNLLFAITA